MEQQKIESLIRPKAKAESGPSTPKLHPCSNQHLESIELMKNNNLSNLQLALVVASTIIALTVIVLSLKGSATLKWGNLQLDIDGKQHVEQLD